MCVWRVREKQSTLHVCLMHYKKLVLMLIFILQYLHIIKTSSRDRIKEFSLHYPLTLKSSLYIKNEQCNLNNSKLLPQRNYKVVCLRLYQKDKYISQILLPKGDIIYSRHTFYLSWIPRDSNPWICVASSMLYWWANGEVSFTIITHQQMSKAWHVK